MITTDSRATLGNGKDQQIRRRKKCPHCGEKCTTYEIHQDMVPGHKYRAKADRYDKIMSLISTMEDSGA